MSGIYIIQSFEVGGTEECVKIGRSKNLQGRWRNYKTSIGNKFRVYATYNIRDEEDDLVRAEEYIHSYYQKHRINTGKGGAKELYLPSVLSRPFPIIQLERTGAAVDPITWNRPMDEVMPLLSQIDYPLTDTIFKDVEIVIDEEKKTILGNVTYTKEHFDSGLVQFWSGNRGVNEERVDKIVSEQRELIQTTGSYLFCGAIILFTRSGFDKSDNLMILDGQHRLSAIKRLVNMKNGPSSVKVETIVYYGLELDEDVRQMFRICNTNTEIVGEYFLSGEYVKEAIDDFVNLITARFIPARIHGKRRPNIRIDMFKNIIAENPDVIAVMLNHRDELLKKITQFSKRLAKVKSMADAKKLAGGNIPESILRGCKKKGLYYGLYKNFEWFVDILETHFGLTIAD